MRKEPHESWSGSIREFAENVVSEENPLRPKLPKEELKCPKSLRKLAFKCWKTDQYKRPTFSQILESLEVILVDCAIFDDTARVFWKKYFMEDGKLVVNASFDSFSKHFLSTFAQNPTNSHKKCNFFFFLFFFFILFYFFFKSIFLILNLIFTFLYIYIFFFQKKQKYWKFCSPKKE